MTTTRNPRTASHRSPLLAAGIGALAAAFPLSTLAQQPRTEATLSPVQVTSSRTPQQARDVLADNIVITSEEIAASGHKNLDDLLQQKRSIEISRNGGPGTNASLFLRGASNAQNVVLIDGVRVGSSSVGGATWSALPLSQVDHIEIVYGPRSTLYGADAIGGVVQIFTKKGEGPPRFNADIGAGSYGARTIEGGLSGATGGEHSVHYAFNLGREKARGFSATTPDNAFSYNPDPDGYTRESASGQLSMDLAPGHEIGLRFLQSHLDAQYDNGDTGYNDRTITDVGAYSVYSRNRLLPNWTSLLQLSRGVDRSRTPSDFGDAVGNTRQDTITWQNDIALGTDLLQLLLERRVEHVDTSDQGVGGSRATNSLAAVYQLKRGAHLASASVRNDDSTQYGSKTTGSLAYGYRLTDALRVNGSVGTSFRAPSYNELYYPGYGVPTNRPESGRNVEAGVYYEKGSDQFSAVAYRNRVTDLLVYAFPCPVSPAAYSFGCAYNVNEALLTGVTLGASTRIGQFTLRGSLDFQNPRDETTDKLLARRARRHGLVALDYRAGPLMAGVETQFSGKRFDDSANTATLGGYALLNLYANYAINRDWSAYARWNNVLDKDYRLANGYATAGSNVFVGVRYGFR
ncbi:TonB-dependent receptor domain-containing protein [Noviherbaspirillum suwonense]|jgi:vitamin B12 transporter|uniref:Vitamin B12 transporter n=1 Tax=Noviherbaspirillum suwonense TaxID=1224511 RepID=A0ABY1QIX2_9BURK|nr:TonB-dependent receptor [Noviherbaspirillum suwonense]SMP72113.1 vitamin B12 transporter [Noviherbaspirillum suwonense]